MSSMNDLEAGKLVAAVELLTTEVKELKAEVDSLKTQIVRGKGILLGIILISSGIGVSVSSAFNKFIGG